MFSIKNRNWTQKPAAVILRIAVMIFLAGLAVPIVTDFRGFGEQEVTQAASSDRTDLQLMSVYEFTLSPDHQQILCRGNRNQIVLRDTVTGSLIDAFDFQAIHPRTIANASTDNMFLTGYEDGSLVLWNKEKEGDQYTSNVLGRRDCMTLTCALSSDLRLVASGYEDGIITIWDARSGTRLKDIQAHSDNARCVRFPTDGRRLLSASSDICVWDVETGKVIAKLIGHNLSVRSDEFSPNGSRVVSGGVYDGTVRVWDVASATELWQAKLDDNTMVLAVAYSPDGKIVASGSTDGDVSLWDVQTHQRLAKLKGPRHPISCLEFSADTKKLYSASMDGTIRVWDISTGMEIQRL